MVGRTDLLELNYGNLPWKAKGIDLSRILYKPVVGESIATHCTLRQDHAIDDILDRRLIQLARPALDKREAVRGEFPIQNMNRAVGAMLSGQICKAYGEEGLPEDTLYFKFKGMAGQSFGAWLAKGVTFELEGMSNDYIGKGISGGKIIVYPDRSADYKAEENIIIGNTTFYGAICGEAYIRGVAGERFCIRNSGLYAVVEGVGDHGCEYMTGGRVVIIGKTGRNFGAGMSGGIAYVYSRDKSFKHKCNMGLVELDKPVQEDIEMVKSLLARHYKYTASTAAKKIIDNFKNELKYFIKVMPLEYKRILNEGKLVQKLHLGEYTDG